MLTLKRPNRKKIAAARKVYETYCETGTKQETAYITGLAYNTVVKYVNYIESLNNKNKISRKDRYYNPGSTEPEPPNPNINNNIIYNNNKLNKKKINKDKEIILINNNKEISNKENNILNINNKENKEEVITNKDYKLKDKILLQHLDNISLKYLNYLKNPTDKQLDKTSLKDHGIIAGILLDKKALLTHKKDSEIKNQSIIFNLFGNNKNLAEFISEATGRQARLQNRPKKKYIPDELNK